MAETSILTTKISEADIKSLEKQYTLRGRNEVLSFIEQNPFLVLLLLEAPDAIRKYFEEGPLYLKLEYDPEIAGYVDLLLLIATDLGPEEAVDKLNEFAFGWWYTVSDQAQGKLLIDTEP